MDILSKIQLFNIYIRPILYYGLESLIIKVENLNMNNLIEIMDAELDQINQNVYDRYMYNPLSQEVEDALALISYRYRNFKLLNLLYISIKTYLNKRTFKNVLDNFFFFR
jgi:hypothetical protein